MYPTRSGRGRLGAGAYRKLDFDNAFSF